MTNYQGWTTGGLYEIEWFSFLITNGQSGLFAEQFVLAEANKWLNLKRNHNPFLNYGQLGS